MRTCQSLVKLYNGASTTQDNVIQTSHDGSGQRNMSDVAAKIFMVTASVYGSMMPIHFHET